MPELARLSEMRRMRRQQATAVGAHGGLASSVECSLVSLAWLFTHCARAGLTCDRLRTCLISLNDGFTYFRLEMLYLASYLRHASTSLSGVKNVPTVGTTS